jgi:hypothetical protein
MRGKKKISIMRLCQHRDDPNFLENFISIIRA